MKYAVLWSVLLFLLGVGISLTGYGLLTKKITPTSLVSSVLPFVKVNLLTPKDVAPALLVSFSGEARKVPWDKFEPGPAATGSALLQGDEVETGIKSKAEIQIKNMAKINLGELSDIIMESMVNERVLLDFRKGEITYDLEGNLTPLNILIGRSIVEIASGSASISYKDQKTEINVKNGKLKLGLNNNYDETNVWELGDGDTASINEATGRVITDGKLVGDNL